MKIWLTLLLSLGLLSLAYADDSGDNDWPDNPPSNPPATSPTNPTTPGATTPTSGSTSSTGFSSYVQTQTQAALQIFNNVSYENFSGSKNSFMNSPGLYGETSSGTTQSSFKIGQQ